MNPQIEESVQFTALNASQDFLNYLQTNALIVDLWGLQGTMLTSSSARHILHSGSCQCIQGCRGERGRWAGSCLNGQEPSSPGSLGSSPQGIMWFNISHNSGAGKLRRFFPGWCLPTTEGCTALSCSQPGLMVTGEGHILVDTKKTATVMDTGQVCMCM